MSVFEIEQMTIHMQRFRVEADREAEAVVKPFDGEAVPVENKLELADLCDDRGLPADEVSCPPRNSARLASRATRPSSPRSSASRRWKQPQRHPRRSLEPCRSGLAFPQGG